MLQWTLRYDEGERELRLVARDFWNGIHEQTEYRVKDGKGAHAARFDGWQVTSAGIGAPFYAAPRGERDHQMLIEAIDPSVLVDRVTCPKVSNRRRKCSVCDS